MTQRQGGPNDRPPRVSIVVPMYNVEDYIADCIESLANQTVAHLCEFLLVDDGSTDRTALLAERATAQHANMRLLRKENGGPGPGSARNFGLEASQGEFVLFCDADDMLETRAVERLVGAMDQFGVDLVVGAVRTFPTSRTWVWSSYFQAGESRLVELEDCPQLVHNAAPGNKLFRRSMLVASGLRFAEGIHHQDTYVTVPAMLYSEKLAIVGDVVELYRKRESGDSIMDGHFTRKENYWDHLQVIEHLSQLLPSLPDGRRELLERFLARSFQGFALRAPTLFRREELRGFFDRASAVVSHLSPECLASATHDPAHRAAYLTMRTGRYSEYQELPDRSNRLVARHGRLYIDVSAVDAEAADLVRVGKIRCEVLGLAWENGVLTVELAHEIRRGPNLLEACNAAILRLTHEETGQRIVAECRPMDMQQGRSIATFHTARLVLGAHSLRLAVITRTGQASASVTVAETMMVRDPDGGLAAEVRSAADGKAEVALMD